MILVLLSIENVYSPASFVPPVSHLTCTPTKSNIELPGRNVSYHCTNETQIAMDSDRF
jgi:hypothetical protein